MISILRVVSNDVGTQRAMQCNSPVLLAFPPRTIFPSSHLRLAPPHLPAAPPALPLRIPPPPNRCTYRMIPIPFPLAGLLKRTSTIRSKERRRPARWCPMVSVPTKGSEFPIASSHELPSLFDEDGVECPSRDDVVDIVEDSFLSRGRGAIAGSADGIVLLIAIDDPSSSL